MEKVERTLGDGIDNNVLKSNPPDRKINKLLNIEVKNKNTQDILKSMRPIEPKSKAVHLVPKYVPKIRKAPKCLVKKPREPKFIPYEPYKAAVQPMVSSKGLSFFNNDLKKSKNDTEIQELVTQMSEMRRSEMEGMPYENIGDEMDGSQRARQKWQKEKETFLVDIKNLRETNSHLENQLKFQAQVNSELKTLLVAAVGEDLESRVQHLTEDKLSLARSLLNYANHLTSHQEKTEWLSGQCEVWRSKFLASSLMVEELAKWKSALSNRINAMQEVMKILLEERKRVHNQSYETLNVLKNISENVSGKANEKQCLLKHGNILDVANVNFELTNSIKDSLHINENERLKTDDKLQPTLAEKTAHKLLQNPVSVSNKQDDLCNAVMGAANSFGGKQLFLQYPSISSCCAHCKGEIQNI
ncbi:unnamed protein product [Phaedon cochleariae]|uniref:Golgin-45 n=1 Tax=Phaedon cochleariae TaxID=80249 RepID=A0A9P0GPJ6_PHACE|nr:unnamed protein product [Phaedon cochleariae]